MSRVSNKGGSIAESRAARASLAGNTRHARLYYLAINQTQQIKRASHGHSQIRSRGLASAAPPPGPRVSHGEETGTRGIEALEEVLVEKSRLAVFGCGEEARPPRLQGHRGRPVISISASRARDQIWAFHYLLMELCMPTVP
ncbi:hypothetical protein E2C01_007111 [Portunus trituberculatus]|uniref:Uncharacterized protein n=1 Tax=Portunus trituberculatus TaxID=210409 RepID=A0A5B7CWZ1_PORTR|nr:hypothetical protein [Portunus trituberculatus]